MLIAALIYGLLLIWVIGFKFNASWIPEQKEVMVSFGVFERLLLPFKSYIAVFATETTNFAYLDYFVNFLLYIPFGVYLNFFVKEKKHCLLIIFLSSLCFEMVQLLTCIGGFDPLDIVANYLGGFLGVTLYLKSRINIPDKIVNIVNTVVICGFGPVLIYAIINTILNFNLYLS